MIRFILFITLLSLCSTLSASKFSIVKKGMWIPVCDGVEISEHNRYDKALEAVINQDANCDIIPPDRFEIRREAIETPKTVVLSWQLPTVKEDGSTLTIIDRFNIYQTFNAGDPVIIEVQATSTSYLLSNLAKGSYEFRISTVSEGLEGKLSPAVIIEVIN